MTARINSKITHNLLSNTVYINFKSYFFVFQLNIVRQKTENSKN